MSKFSGVFQTSLQELPLLVEEPVPAKTKIRPARAEQPVVTKIAKPGRPRAKRSNPDYCQVTAYIRQDTYNKVRMSLLGNGDKRDFSELIEALLVKFLSTQKPI